MQGQSDYDLNLFAFGTFSPVNTRSAPTFFPLLGHPYLGPNKLQELIVKIRLQRKTMLINERIFISKFFLLTTA